MKNISHEIKIANIISDQIGDHIYEKLCMVKYLSKDMKKLSIFNGNKFIMGDMTSIRIWNGESESSLKWYPRIPWYPVLRN